jgi:hypothetical protein
MTNNINNKIIFIFSIAITFILFFNLRHRNYQRGLPLLDSKSYPSVSM